MPMNPEEIKDLIIKGIPDASVTIISLKDDNDHFQAEVIASSFKGISRVQQHRRVYDSLNGALGGPLHALSLITKIPT